MRVVPLGDVCAIVGGGTPRRNNEAYFGGDIPWATPTDVTALSDLSIARTKETITETGLRESSARLVPTGTVLLTSRATIGYAAIAERPMATNQGFANFICGDYLVPEYLAYWLRGQQDHLIRLAGGTTFKEISKSTLKGIPIPLPPIGEQRRIAGILDRAARIERLRARATDLLHTFASALFVKTFGDPAKNPMGWKVSRLGGLCKMDRRGLQPDDPATQRLSFVGVENVGSGTGALDFDSDSRVGSGKSTTFRFDARHILYAKLRPYLNKVATPDFEGRCSTELIPLLPHEDVDRDYLVHLLRREETVAFAMKSVTGTRMPRTDMKMLMSMPVFLPPLDEQRRFASIVNRSARAATVASAASKAASALTASLMDRLLDGSPAP